MKVLAIVFLGMFSLLASLAFNGDRALWDTSETRYAEAAREMVSTGDWLIPRIAGEPHLTKPPLTYWLLALSMKMFGFSEGAVRFPVALAYAISVAVTAWLGWRLTCSFRAGLIAGLLQMVSPMAFFGGHVVTTDTFVALFALLYLSAMWGALTTFNLRKARIWVLFMYVFLGLAFLTKGPPALLPALAGLIFLIILNEQLQWERLVSFAGVGVFIAVSASWYAIVLYVDPDAVHIWKQEAVVKVFVSSSRNMPAYYYPVILLGGALPGVIVVAKSLWRRLVHTEPVVGFNLHQREAILFLGIWIGLPLMIFMVSKTRLILYVLPLVPAINILGAAVSYDHVRESQLKFWPVPPSWAITCFALLCALIGTKLLVAQHGDLSKDMKPIATAIRIDSVEHNVVPELIITMGRMGNGLLYYLECPPTVRLADNRTPGSSLNKSTMLATEFLHRVPDDHGQYIIVPDSDLTKYLRKLDGYALPIYFNGQWAVFRRNVNSPVFLQRTQKSRLITQYASGTPL